MITNIENSTVQYTTVHYSTVQYCTVQYSTVQYSTVQYSTVQYNTVSVLYQYLVSGAVLLLKVLDGGPQGVRIYNVRINSIFNIIFLLNDISSN